MRRIVLDSSQIVSESTNKIAEDTREALPQDAADLGRVVAHTGTIAPPYSFNQVMSGSFTVSAWPFNSALTYIPFSSFGTFSTRFP